jgi:hypothetical protein
LETIDLAKVNFSWFYFFFLLSWTFSQILSSTGSVFYEKSLGIVRMQTLFDSAQQWGFLFSSYTSQYKHIKFLRKKWLYICVRVCFCSDLILIFILKTRGKGINKI